MLFPTIPIDDADRLLACMAELNEREGPKAAAIILPSSSLEAKLSCCGYGKSVNHLVSRAFADRRGGLPRPLLGMSLESIRRGKAASSEETERRRRIAALAVRVGPQDLRRPAAVAQGKQLITTDEGIEEIVRERLLSRSEGRPTGGEDRVQGASATNGEGGSHRVGVGSLLHPDRGTGPVPAGDRDQLGERPEA